MTSRTLVGIPPGLLVFLIRFLTKKEDHWNLIYIYICIILINDRNNLINCHFSSRKMEIILTVLKRLTKLNLI